MGNAKSQQDDADGDMSKKHKLGPMGGASHPDVLLHRDLSTNTQIGMLLSVCGSMAPVLFTQDREFENIPGVRVLPGEARIAAENTFREACERLESIIKDSRRWGIEYQLEIEKNYLERHGAQMAAIKSAEETEKQRRAAMEAMTLPHFRYKPTLFHTDTGWVAFLGSPEDMESGILGIGDSPGEALKSFDLTFEGELSPEVQAWLKKHETDLEKGIPTTEPFPKNNEDQMDAGRTEQSSTPPSAGDAAGGDRPKA